MGKKYANLDLLLEQDGRAKQYFDTVPDYVKESLCQRADDINSFTSLCSYVDKLTRGDD